MGLKAALFSFECDKMSSLLAFYVDEKFTHEVIYLNTKSSIFLCQGENLQIKFITLLSDANVFLTKAVHICNQVSCFDIKFLALISSLLCLHGIQLFPGLQN